MKKRLFFALGALILLGAAFGTSYINKASATVSGTNVLVSYKYDNSGPSTGAATQEARISEDGNIVAFESQASDIIVGGVTGSSLYVRNMKTNTNTLVSKTYTGANAGLGGGNGRRFAMSRTGRYIAFANSNTNVVASPTVPSGSMGHIYLIDTQLNAVSLVDISASGVVGNNGYNSASAEVTAVSDDGRFVSFRSQSTNLLSSGNPTSTPNFTLYPYIKDRLTGIVINPLTSNTGARANASAVPLIHSSCDGEVYVYSSNATNLTPNDNGKSNVYLVDLRNGYNISNLTYATNVDLGALNLSCNGRYLVVSSKATTLTSDSVNGTKTYKYRFDRLDGSFTLLDKSTAGYISTDTSAVIIDTSNRVISDDGKVAFWGDDVNMVSPAAAKIHEVYLRDPDANTTELVPISTSGTEQSPVNTSSAPHYVAISANGKNVLYASIATNLIPGITSGGPSPDGNVVVSKVQ